MDKDEEKLICDLCDKESNMVFDIRTSPNMFFGHKVICPDCAKRPDLKELYFRKAERHINDELRSAKSKVSELERQLKELKTND